MNISPRIKLEMFRQMLRIRKFQLRIEAEYHQDRMKTPVHLCLGQEAAAVGAAAALEPEDYISSNHRGHGHYLAKGGDIYSLAAELHCRETGCSKGRGGSMHLVDVSVGHLGSSSIVGGGIPIGVGLALAASLKGEARVSMIFFGDGAADEGVFYESLNFARLKKLPVIFVLENNQFSVCSPLKNRWAGENVFHYLPQEDLPAVKVDGNDVLAVYEEARRAVDLARQGGGPSFIECLTYRVREHHGAGVNRDSAYRPAGEIEAWENCCPVERFENHLFEEGLLTRPDLEKINEDLDREIDAAFAFAKVGPLPRAEDLPRYLYCE